MPNFLIRKVALSMLLVVITVATASAAQTLSPLSTFTENFDDLSKWIPFGTPSPQILATQFGRSGVFDNNGDATFQSGAISVQAFSGIGGLTIQSDVYLDFSDTALCNVEAAIGIANGGLQLWGGYDPLMYFSIRGVGRSCTGIDESLKGHAYFYGVFETSSGAEAFNPSLANPTLFLADDYVGGWHTLKISTDITGKPRFYIDDILIYTGANSASTAILTSTNPLWIGSQSSGSGGKAYHDNLTFTAGCSWPAAISLVAPAASAILCNPQVAMSWTSDGAATEYQIQVDDDSDFSSAETDLTLPSSTTGLSIMLADDCTPRYWRVRGISACAIGDWSTARSFKICISLAPPALVSPVDGAVDLVQPVAIDFGDVNGATGYSFQLDNDSNFASPVFDLAVVESEYEVSQLVGSTTYYWHVRANNPCGHSAWSATREFTTEVCLLPEPTVLQSPADGDSNQIQPVVLNWADANLATAYQVQLDDDTAFASPLIDQQFAPSTGSISGLPAGATRFWRVRSYNACGWSGWTPPRSFSTCAPIAAPALIEPANNAVIESMPVFFDWSTLGAADSYLVEIDIVNSFNSSYNMKRKMASISQFGTYDIALATRYYWRVCAYSDCGWGLFSAVRTCSIGTTLAVEDIESGVLPQEFQLSQNYPNPFNAETTIEFDLPRSSWVRLEILNILGQQVAVVVDESLSAGRKRTTWNGLDSYERSAPSGLYFYRFTAGDYVAVKKMVLLK